MPPKPTSKSLSGVTKRERGKGKGINTNAAGVSKALRATRSSSSSTSSKSSSLKNPSTAKMQTTTITPAPSSSSPTNSTSPIFFWRPTDPNAYLGQWYASPFTHESSTYATAEMWMMVQKALLFGDQEVAKKMLSTTDPKRHKALGRTVRGFDGAIWDENKLNIVETGTYHKFTISADAPNLRAMLLATGDSELVEASPLDRIWGVGFAAKNAAQNRHRWGRNLLGVALMRVRERLREEEKEKLVKEGEV